MGMDYRYAGSASYPRFDQEITEIAKLFGGVLSEDLSKRKEDIPEWIIDHWFGFMSSAPDNMEKFVFPEGANPLLVKWFNHIYDEFSPEETAEIFKELSKKRDEVYNISDEVICEFDNLIKYNEGWGIC